MKCFIFSALCSIIGVCYGSEFSTVAEAVRSNGKSYKKAHIEKISADGVTIFYSGGILKLTLREFMDDAAFRAKLDPDGKSIPLITSKLSDQDAAQAVRENIQPFEGPEWNEATAAEIKRLMPDFDWIVVPVVGNPGVYFRGKWIPLGITRLELRRMLPELVGTPAMLAVANTSMMFVFVGDYLREISLVTAFSKTQVSPSVCIIGGVKLRMVVSDVTQVFGRPSASNLPYEVTYARNDHELEIGFNYGSLSVITLKRPLPK
ncbi:MAG TPA: hypothetical protein VG838_08785 [Opitutaceae bacterium]|nr:hypothetical protein [Opitutaceae bacterium]